MTHPISPNCAETEVSTPLSALPPDASYTLSRADQEHLVRAIAAALDVTTHTDFHRWMAGPVRELLPHRRVVCIELGRDSGIQHVESLDHETPEAPPGQAPGDPHVALALRLLDGNEADATPTHAFDTRALTEVLSTVPAISIAPSFAPPSNAIVHRVTFLSGTAYHFVLMDCCLGGQAESAARCHQLLRLLSTHLKMAWSKVIDLPFQPEVAETRPDNITDRERDILRCMHEGKTNQAISRHLGISPITLKDHIRKIYRKLDVQQRSHAIERTASWFGTPAPGAESS